MPARLINIKYITIRAEKVASPATALHNPPGPPHACRTRTLRTPAKTRLAGDNIDAPAAFAVPFRPYCGGVVTRTRNVSEYMLVLALCLVLMFIGLQLTFRLMIY